MTLYDITLSYSKTSFTLWVRPQGENDKAAFSKDYILQSNVFEMFAFAVTENAVSMCAEG